MNNKLGTKMPCAQDHNSIQSLIDVVKQQFTGKDKIEEAIYSTFIDRKNDLQTTIQLYKFYGIVLPYNQMEAYPACGNHFPLISIKASCWG